MVPHLPTCLRSCSSCSFRGLGWRGGEGHKRKSKDGVGPVLESPPPPPIGRRRSRLSQTWTRGRVWDEGGRNPFPPLTHPSRQKKRDPLKERKGSSEGAQKVPSFSYRDGSASLALIYIVGRRQGGRTSPNGGPLRMPRKRAESG